MLKRIKIAGYKTIRDQEIDFSNLNVLIGANGAGKTNLISLFTLLNRLVEQSLQVFVRQSGGANALLYFGQKVTSEIVIQLDFGGNGYKCKLMTAAGDELFFADEECWGTGTQWTQPYPVVLGQGHRESKLMDEAQAGRGKISEYTLAHMHSWRIYHFHDTSASAGVKQTGDIDDNALLRPNAANLAAFLYLLRERHPEHYKLILETIRLAAPFFDDFVLRPSRLAPTKIQLEWREKGSDAYFNAGYLSDGTLRFICLTTLLLQPHLPSTIVIDEPELGLHPYAITLLASLLQSAAAKTQVIVSTQSAPLVNQFLPDHIIVVDRVGPESVFRRLTVQEINIWLDEYGLGDLWEKNVLGGRPQR